MIEKGNLIVDGYVDEVMRPASRILPHIRVKDDTDKAAGLLEQSDLVDSVNVTSTALIGR